MRGLAVTAGTSMKPFPSVLLVGESWVAGGTHIKGVDLFQQPRYEEGGKEFVAALRSSGAEVTRVPAHLACRDFPSSIDALSAYDVVVLSDVGADSFELTDDCISGERSVSRLRVLADWVAQSGSLLMIGGYMSFSGFQARARFSRSPLAAVLPVELLTFDDRVERPDGVTPRVVNSEHEITAGLDASWPFVLGYNEFRAKASASTLVSVEDDPLLVVGTHGRGRVAAYASDCSPHWASREFLAWPGYATFFCALVKWLAVQ
jgi:uncharacterized membrane protein